jgi:hypothetical protein
MPSTLDLINSEQLANTLFLISTLYAYVSGNEATKVELEKQQGSTTSSDSRNPSSLSHATKSAEKALISTCYAVVALIINTMAAIARKQNLEKDIASGNSTASIIPSIIIITGLILSAIGSIMKLPALKERIKESIPTIL